MAFTKHSVAVSLVLLAIVNGELTSCATGGCPDLQDMDLELFQTLVNVHSGDGEDQEEHSSWKQSNTIHDTTISSELIDNQPKDNLFDEDDVDSDTVASDNANSNANPGALSPAILAAIRVQAEGVEKKIRVQVKEEFDSQIATLKERISLLEEKLQDQSRPAGKSDGGSQLLETKSSSIPGMAAGTTYNVVTNGPESAWNDVKDRVRDAINTIVDPIKDIVNKIKWAVKKAFNWVKDLWNEHIKPIVNHIGKCAKSAKSPGSFIECLIRPVLEKIFAAIFPEASVAEAVTFPFQGKAHVYDPVLDGYVEVAPDKDIVQDDLRDHAGQSCGSLEKEFGFMKAEFHACNLPFGLTSDSFTSPGQLVTEVQKASRECARSRALYDDGSGQPSLYAGISDLSQRSHRDLTNATRVAANIASQARSAFLNEGSDSSLYASKQAAELAQKSCHDANAASLLAIRAVAGKWEAQDRVVSDFEDLYMKAIDCHSHLFIAKNASSGWREAAERFTRAEELIGRLRYDMQSLYRNGDVADEVKRIFKQDAQPRNVYDLAELAENCVIGYEGYMKAYVGIKIFDYEVMRVSMHERDGFKYAYLDFQIDGTTVKHEHFSWKRLSQQDGATIAFCGFFYCVNLRLKLTKGLNNLFGIPMPEMASVLRFGSVDFVDISIDSFKITLKKIGIPVEYSLPVGTGFPFSKITIPFVVNPTPTRLYTFSKQPVDECLMDLNVNAGELSTMSATSKRNALISKLSELGEGGVGSLNGKTTEDLALINCRVAKYGNYYRKEGYGKWGGMCTCPDGQVFEVGADSCTSTWSTLACEGGVAGPCSEDGIGSSSHGMKVTCERAIQPSATLAKCLVFLGVSNSNDLLSITEQEKLDAVIAHLANKANLDLSLLQEKSSDELAAMCEMAHTQVNGYHAVAKNEANYEKPASAELQAVMDALPQTRSDEECSLASSRQACQQGCKWTGQICEADFQVAVIMDDPLADIKNGDIIYLYNDKTDTFLGTCGSAVGCDGASRGVYGYGKSVMSKWQIEMAGSIVYLKDNSFGKYLGMCGQIGSGSCDLSMISASHNVYTFDSKSEATQFQIQVEREFVYLYLPGYGYLGMCGNANCNGPVISTAGYPTNQDQDRTRFMIQKHEGLLKAAPVGGCRLKMGHGHIQMSENKCEQMRGTTGVGCYFDWCTDGEYAAAPKGHCTQNPMFDASISMVAKDCREMGGSVIGDPHDEQFTQCTLEFCTNGLFGASTPNRAQRVGYGVVVMAAGDCQAIGGEFNDVNPLDTDEIDCHLGWYMLPINMLDVPDEIIDI